MITPEARKHQAQHLEQAADRQVDFIVDESLVRAENEDKVTSYTVLVILAAAIAGFLFGYDTGIVGSALPLVGDDLGHVLSYSETEITTAGTTIGAIFGAAILGTMADKLGRKMSLLIADVAFTAGAILIATSYSVGQIIAGRVVLGVGVGGAAVIAPLYITELAPTAIRGRCLGTNAFFIPFGQVVASGIGAGMANVPNAWRILFGLGVVPSVIQLCLMHWLPESPRVLIMRGQEDKALAILRKIYKTAPEEIIQLKLLVARNNVEASTQMQRSMSFWQRTKKLWTHKPYRRPIITVSGLNMFTQLTGFNVFLYYSGTLFGLLGFEKSAPVGLIPSGINALFVFIGMSVVDRVGRRRLALIGLPIMASGLLWAVVSVYFMAKPTGGKLVEGFAYDSSLAGALIGAIALFVVGYGCSYSHLSWYQSEFLALEIRAVGSAISTVVIWLANLVISVSFLTQLESIGPAGLFGLYLGFLMVGWVFVFFCYPETRGISVDEVQVIFQDGFGVRRSEELRAEKIAMKRRMHSEESAEPASPPIEDEKNMASQLEVSETPSLGHH